VRSPRRPPLRYHGGKWRIAPWIISHFPPHRVYVEPFGGGASVLLRKRRSPVEVYNDLEGEVVHLFRTLRDRQLGGALVDQLRLTPFSRSEFDAAFALTDDPVERARRFVVRSHQGFGSNSVLLTDARQTGFRGTRTTSNTAPAANWRDLPDCLLPVIERLQGVVIENRPAEAVCRAQGAPDTLLYVDPPYMPDTRSRGNLYCAKHRYKHELTPADHAALLELLVASDAMVVLSGYPHPLYDEALRGWAVLEHHALADGGRARTEVLWINQRAVAAGAPLFEGAA